MEAIAKTKYLKGSPRKARLVIDLIRGRNVSQALAILKFTDKRAAAPIAKTLRSAIANATYLAEQQNIAIDPDDLWVKSCFVDMGPTKNRRRMRPAPQGRAYREQRHYCHITVLVSSEEIVKKNAKKAKPVKEEANKVSTKKGDEGDKSSGEKKAKTAAKKDEVKETKKAKKEVTAEEIETAQATEATAKPAEPKEAKAAEKVDREEAKNEAEVSEAKEATSQTEAEQNETAPADEAQEDSNEELERQ
jgi:large subunit ribosomal protein L22